MINFIDEKDKRLVELFISYETVGYLTTANGDIIKICGVEIPRVHGRLNLILNKNDWADHIRSLGDCLPTSVLRFLGSQSGIDFWIDTEKPIAWAMSGYCLWSAVARMEQKLFEG